jgi:predicted membrane-bound dolichyl-phosphate-mannose-protein mannosyltransferase
LRDVGNGTSAIEIYFMFSFLTVLYFLVISAGAEAYSRFKVPVMPMYALLIGGGAAGIIRWIQRIRTSRTALAIATKA